MGTTTLYVCIAALALLLPALAVCWLKDHPSRIAAGAGRRLKRMSPATLWFLALLAAQAIVYGGGKPTRGAPAPRSVPQAPGPIVSPARDAPQGYMLWRTGTNELWDFTAPLNATVAEEWKRRGAAEDDMLLTNADVSAVLDTHGGLAVGGVSYRTAEFQMGVLPEAQWHLLGTEGGKSQAWLAKSAWGSTVATWENVLACRSLAAPVSVQVEIMNGGDFVCRYDWSRAGANATNETSRMYYRIRPEDLVDPDRDGDGIDTMDEITVFHTDPGLADTDGDGIGDADDDFPLDPDADGDGIPDSMTEAEYSSHPLWTCGDEPGEQLGVDIRLNAPVVPPARAVLVVGDLPIVLTTNAVYRLYPASGVRYDIRLVTNRVAPVNLSIEGVEQ